MARPNNKTSFLPEANTRSFRDVNAIKRENGSSYESARRVLFFCK
jgi:hypothetical protein